MNMNANINRFLLLLIACHDRAREKIGLSIELTSGFSLTFVVIRCDDEDQDSDIECY